MYNYKIGYSSYEDSSYIELTHKKKFSEKQITAMLSEALVDIVKRNYALPKEKRDYLHNFSNFMTIYRDNRESVGGYLVRNFGFKPIAYELVWSCFGWPSVFVSDDWKGERDERLEEITKAINAAGFGREHDTHFQYEQEARERYQKEHGNGRKDTSV